MEIINLITIPRTGTMFILHLLLLSNDIGPVFLFKDKLPELIDNNLSDFAEEIQNINRSDEPYIWRECSDKKRYIVIQAHVNNFYSKKLILSPSTGETGTGKKIFTVRHPFRTIKSNMRRLTIHGMPQGWNHKCILEFYLDLIVLAKACDNSVVIPIDELATWNENDRITYMKNQFDNIDIELNDDMIQYISKWEKSNIVDYADWDLSTEQKSEIAKDVRDYGIIPMLNREFNLHYDNIWNGSAQ